MRWKWAQLNKMVLLQDSVDIVWICILILTFARHNSKWKYDTVKTDLVQIDAEQKKGRASNTAALMHASSFAHIYAHMEYGIWDANYAGLLKILQYIHLDEVLSIPGWKIHWSSRIDIPLLSPWHWIVSTEICNKTFTVGHTGNHYLFEWISSIFSIGMCLCFFFLHISVYNMRQWSRHIRTISFE